MAWNVEYASLLFLSSVIFYIGGMVLGYVRQDATRKTILALTVGLNLLILFIFKYYNFFEEQFNALAVHLGNPVNAPALNLLLPMGISFYTFQGISYLVDVYRRDMLPERHVGILLLYISFFPQLVAGPIERGTHFIPQLRERLLVHKHKERIHFEYDRVASGLRLMLLGFFKKIVLADNFALIVEPVYTSPNEYGGLSALVATVAFAFQIFFDFSAYTDIARGIARIVGFELIENFNRPYFATSIMDFWKRWHISLSSWFRDYLYIPLGGNRVSTWRWQANLWIVFLLCGLWHGANWTFLIWGALHGFYYLITYLLTPGARWLVAHTFLAHTPRLRHVTLMLITFSLVCWAWVMFRAETLSQALTIWNSIAHVPAELYGLWLLWTGEHDFSLEMAGLRWLVYPSDDKLSLMPVYVFAMTAIYMVLSHLMRSGRDGSVFAKLHLGGRWVAYGFALSSILLLGQFGKTTFIYFQF